MHPAGHPDGKVDEMVARYRRDDKVMHENELLAFGAVTIVNVYQQRFRGIAEYYGIHGSRGKPLRPFPVDEAQDGNIQAHFPLDEFNELCFIAKTPFGLGFRNYRSLNYAKPQVLRPAVRFR